VHRAVRVQDDGGTGLQGPDADSAESDRRQSSDDAEYRVLIAAGASQGGAQHAAPLFLLIVGLAACSRAPAKEGGEGRDKLFTLLPSSYTGVRFANRLHESQDNNVFRYRNYYNGGGVAIGDLTGDGLPELVLTSNEGGPRLYLNLGHFQFRDVTDSAGIAEHDRWTTGVTLADVNGDGLLDIYVCHAGLKPGALRANTLYINQGMKDGVPRFKEMAAAYGIADTGYSTQAAFFDYDGDGDLDLFLIRNSPRPVSTIAVRNMRSVRDPLGGHELYRNDGGHFVNVSEQAGIFGPEIGFGLGIAIGDVNRDGRPDMYVANDFFERDYLYVNKGDGTFDEVLEKAMPVSSYFSMGVDIADINNDGWPDIYTSDMLPADDYRLKTTSNFEPWDVYEAKAREGFDHQLMRNMLQRNNGDGTFSDIGQLAGVARTDWSWAALIADFDLDGNKDIFVANGLAKDVTAQDYIAFLASNLTSLAATQGKRVDFMSLVKAMTSTRLRNYAFRNDGDLTFSNVSAEWGLDLPSFSNGAAYGDLDGDGAPDLVVNNVDDEVSVYRNNARALLPDNHYLQVRLQGDGANPFAVGARVTLYTGKQQFMQELEPTRGFQSSVDYVLTFGVGRVDTVDSLRVDWPDGRTSARLHVGTNQRITIGERDSSQLTPPRTTHPSLRSGQAHVQRTLFTDVTAETRVDFVHHEDDFVDFDREPLIPKMLSTEGPFVTVGDVNGDGLDDFFIGGAKGQPSALYVQRPNGTFVATNQALFEQDAISEDLGAAFFDANGDGKLDLYVVTGGDEFGGLAPPLEDRLYLGDGRGNFTRTTGQLPPLFGSGSRVAVSKNLVFIGGRVVPGRYGVNPPSTLLRNDGHGRFTDVTAEMAPDLARAGMVTDALWSDIDGDGRPDLVVVGEWMPITVFHNTGTQLVRQMPKGLEHSAGWWNRIIAGDFNGDGRTDFVLGNLGLNSRLHASPTEPARMYVKDFGYNGFPKQIVTCYEGGKSLPLVLRDELTAAIPYLKPKYPKYSDYAGQTVEQIFGSALSDAVVQQVETFASAIALSNPDGSYTLVSLPREAQLAPVYGILAGDFDRDGKLDLLLAGNFDGVQPEIGRLAASYGLFLRGDGHGGFTPVRAAESGFFVPGAARDIQRLHTRAGDLYVVARNNDRPLFFRAAPASARRPLALLRFDENHAVSAARSPLRGAGGITQHRDRLDVVRVDSVQVAGRVGAQRDTVHDDQGFLAPHDRGTATPDLDNRPAIRVAPERETGNARHQDLLERHPR
ncbi:MAG TPA: VCBS repeat-containing protein, partial [Gemmatimonadales bacterium]|nr:VCBS repeat-containing protein [Gemmatimonadales bacterium]